MTRHKHFGIRELVFRLSEYALALTIVFVLTVVASRAAQAQYTYTELHNFTGGQDGANPEAGLTMDVPGNLYGTAVDGGNGCSPYGGCGTVFKLKRSGSNFLFDPLYSFISGDGTYPVSQSNLRPERDSLRHDPIYIRERILRHGFQSETLPDSLQGCTLHLDGNPALYFPGRQ